MLGRRTRKRWRILLMTIMTMMVKVISITERNVNVVNGKVLCLATESGRHIPWQRIGITIKVPLNWFNQTKTMKLQWWGLAITFFKIHKSKGTETQKKSSKTKGLKLFIYLL